MSTPMKRLFDLEIDEVSAVDRPANQHGLIQVAKAFEDDDPESEFEMVEIPADTDYGDVLVDESGQPYVFLPEDASDEEIEAYVGAEDEDDPDEDPEVGKALPTLERVRQLTNVAQTGRRMGQQGVKGRQTASRMKKYGETGELRAHTLGNVEGRAENWARHNPGKAAAAGAVTAGVAGGGAYMLAHDDKESTAKSAGTAVLEALSKAVTDNDRDQIVAKMADELEATRADNEAIAKALEEERDLRITEAFIAKAAEYDLPVEPAVFGPILKSIAEVLDDEQLTVLDEVLMSKGVDLFDERGFAGGATNSGVLDEVYGVAAELVGKAAGNFSLEQATVAMFETNPAAYDAYLAEQNGR